jgi:hypothetical protein
MQNRAFKGPARFAFATPSSRPSGESPGASVIGLHHLGALESACRFALGDLVKHLFNVHGLEQHHPICPGPGCNMPAPTLAAQLNHIAADHLVTLFAFKAPTGTRKKATVVPT